MKSRFSGVMLMIIVVGCVITLVKVNKWIQQEMGELGKTEEAAPEKITESALPKETAKPKRRTGEVIRKTRLAPERTFELSVFYQGGEEIARYKESRKGKVYDQAGDIPDGKVKFINETNRTFGVEYYRDNLKHGLSRTSYHEGQLKIEANYFYGKLMNRNEYYIDGVLKREVDYSDAMEFKDNRNSGIGKMYARDGKVKFEWYLVNSDPVKYYKSYDNKGSLTSAVYFDEYGNEKSPKKSPTETRAVPPSDILPH